MSITNCLTNISAKIYQVWSTFLKAIVNAIFMTHSVCLVFTTLLQVALVFTSLRNICTIHHNYYAKQFYG